MSALRSAVGPCVAALLLAGCMAAKTPAPVVERAPEGVRPAAKAQGGPPAAGARRGPVDARPDTYVVRRGDTLYGIALDHGQDYRDLARWNNIVNPSAIEVGQVLRVRDPQAAPVLAAPATGGVVTTPLQSPPPVQGRDFTTDPPKPVAAAPAEAGLPPGVLTEPRAVKLPYSDAALAKLQPGAADARPVQPPVAAERADAQSTDDPDAVAWAWPTQGKVVASFNENGGPKGVQIAGELGQPVLASAGGRVVYTGSGLRGYGNLVIIKHNNTYLSAYAHNRSVLVKQGDNVNRGQKIAEMGNSDTNRVMLHFEIRRQGKPVDPVKFLPPA